MNPVVLTYFHITHFFQMKAKKSNTVTLFQVKVTYVACAPFVCPFCPWGHSKNSSEPSLKVQFKTHFSESTLLNIRKFRPRHSQWLSWSCLIFPVSEGFVPTGGTISLRKHSEKLKAHVRVSTSAVIIAVINWILPMPWSRSSPTSVCDPGSLSRSCTHKGPCSCFYALLCQLGILSSFWTGRRVFSFCSGPHQVCSCSWLLVLYILSHLMLTNHLQGVDSIIPIAQSRTSRISERSHVLWRRRLGNIVKKCWSQSPPSFQFRLVLV